MLFVNIQIALYNDRLEITSPGKLPMGQTLERMKEGYSKIIDKVKHAGLREPEFIGGEVDLRINIYRNQLNAASAAQDIPQHNVSADK